MAVKANGHPLIRDLRRLIAKHRLHGALFLGVDGDGETMTASVGHTADTCDALGPLLSEPEIDLLYVEMMVALDAAKKGELT